MKELGVGDGVTVGFASTRTLRESIGLPESSWFQREHHIPATAKDFRRPEPPRPSFVGQHEWAEWDVADAATGKIIDDHIMWADAELGVYAVLIAESGPRGTIIYQMNAAGNDVARQLVHRKITIVRRGG